MTVATPGPCSAWATADDLSDCHDTSTFDAEQITQALDSASALLWEWSGYKYPGVCTDTVRPCSQNESADWGMWDDSLYRYGFGYGGWWNWWPQWGYCGCNSNTHRDCGCSFLSEIELGRAPILSVSTVKVDGVTLAAGTDYRVDDYAWLVRLGAGKSWPCCQDLSLDDTHTNTFSVAFTWGRNPPASGLTACVELAWDILETCATGNCAPPNNAGTITRQGTGITFIAPERYGLDLFGNMKIGIPAVDRFLLAVGHGRPGLLVSPESSMLGRRVNT